MHLLDQLRLNFYPELKRLELDDSILKQILSNPNFKDQYKTSIKPFIKYLREYRDPVYHDLGLDETTISHHLEAIFELSIYNNASKYVSFIKQFHYEDSKINNCNIFNDPNFERIYSMIGSETFRENICGIINSGNSERLIQFLEQKSGIPLAKINSAMFEDKAWRVIHENPSIGNTTVVELFHSKIDVLVDLINKDLLTGVKYTYETIPESHSFIENQLNGNSSLQQFSMDFIKNIGDETLKQLYSRCTFSDERECKKLFEIVSFGNYELIRDIVNYDTYGFHFRDISTDDMSKQLLETNINGYNKNEVFLNKYLGIERKDIYYIKLFLNAINKVAQIPSEFQEQYGDLLQLLNHILTSNDEGLLNIGKAMKLAKEDYKKLITDCERDGNDVLRRQFVHDLKMKNQQILNTAEHKEILASDGSKVDVYELTGQPFTMLVHAIANNTMSIHNSLVSKIINDPENWNQINEGNNNISVSLISDRFMVTYRTPDNGNTIMFGFNDISWSSLKFTNVVDSGIDRKADPDTKYDMRNKLFSINTITTVDDLMEKTIERNLHAPSTDRIWNEICLSRVEETTGVKIQPNYIVCMDSISESSVRAASQFKIPIYFIHRNCYPELPYISENNSASVEMSEGNHAKK